MQKYLLILNFLKMFCVAFSGGSGSGKSSVLQYMANVRNDAHIAILPMDAYYKDHSHLSLQERKIFNFDDLQTIDFNLFIDHVESLKSGKPVRRPVYSFVTCSRLNETVLVYPGDILFIEGLFILNNERLRELADFTVFLDGSVDIRLQRVIQRDLNERNRDREETEARFTSMVEPMYKLHIEPARKYADLIIDASLHDIPYIASVIWDAINYRMTSKLSSVSKLHKSQARRG